MTDSIDEKYMQIALKLAQRGISFVEPNPAVGCVIVKSGQIVGKGCHKKYGGPHAEINALSDCETLSVNPRGATMYITLEPCCHHGQTSPCTDAIIAAEISKVVVAMIDPSQHARGKGIEQLKNAGIDVTIGVCTSQAQLLNAPFIKFALTQNTWIILKWAQTIDGKMAWKKEFKQRWISSEQSRKDVHKLRRRTQGILVGVNTVIADDPLLTARPSKGKTSTRIVLDSNLRIPIGCKLLATAKKTPVLIVTTEQAIDRKKLLVEKITQKGAELLIAPTDQDKCDLKFLTDKLAARGIAQLLVEGGPTVIASFLKEKLVDEICVYISPKILGSQGCVEIARSIDQLSDSFDLYNVEAGCFGDDICLRGMAKESLFETPNDQNPV